MSIFNVINKATNEIVYIYNSDSPVEWVGMEFNTHDHVEAFTDVAPTAEIPIKVWEPIAYMRRFTASERKAIWAAQAVNPDIDDAVRLLMATSVIHSNDADVIRLTYALESFGLIAAGRADEVLNAN